MIDRLEQAGYVRRVPDPADRRRVIVEVVPEKIAADPVDARPGRRRRAPRRSADYTDAQLELIADFLTQMEPITREEASDAPRAPATRARRRAGDRPSTPRRSAGSSRRRLAIRSGLSSCASGPASTRPSSTGRRSRARRRRSALRDGRVLVQYQGHRLRLARRGPRRSG